MSTKDMHISNMHRRIAPGKRAEHIPFPTSLSLRRQTVAVLSLILSALKRTSSTKNSNPQPDDQGPAQNSTDGRAAGRSGVPQPAPALSHPRSLPTARETTDFRL
jgi:hypothetical protein